jgi:uncharacterized protein
LKSFVAENNRRFQEVEMYFEKPGPENTELALELAIMACADRGIKHLVVASTVGDTARKALEMIKGRGIKLVAVTHNYGFSEEGKCEFDDSLRAEIEQAGHKVLSATLVIRNLGKAISLKMGYSESEIVSNTLRVFGQGAKVCIEMACMAADHGLVPNEDCVFVAGTARGADTALIIRPAASNNFFNLKVREIICKPKSF